MLESTFFGLVTQPFLTHEERLCDEPKKRLRKRVTQHRIWASDGSDPK